MMKNIVFSLALLGALTETGPAFAESKSLPDCAVTSAKSHGVELTLYRALMIHELGDASWSALLVLRGCCSQSCDIPEQSAW